jgi:hypothetical protein
VFKLGASHDPTQFRIGCEGLETGHQKLIVLKESTYRKGTADVVFAAPLVPDPPEFEEITRMIENLHYCLIGPAPCSFSEMDL